MAAKKFDVRQEKDGSYHVHGDLTIHELEELRGFLESILKDRQEVSLSLAAVSFVDTAALQLLIAYRKRFAPETRLRVSDVSPEVEYVLSLSGLKTARM